MSTCSRRRRRQLDDRGFTLVEIMVALGLLVVIMAAALPAFIAMLRSTVTTRLETQGKNLTQERLEQMRDLRFHVDRQNGPFLDVLDVYYTHAKTGQPDQTVAAGGATLVGNYVSTGAAASGLPAAPYYKSVTTIAQGGKSFTQTIAAQFLTVTGAAVPSSRFQNIYDSQTVGKDQAPSLMLGVTVVTTWVDAKKTKTYRAYTRITDGRPQLPVIQSQGKAIAIEISSTAVDGTTLDLQGGIATANGSQSSGSSVSGYAGGALATRTGQAPVSGLVTQFNRPTSTETTSGISTPQNSASCNWYGFGSTGTDNVNGDVSAGLPLAPSNVATPGKVISGYIAKNGSGSCGQLSFDNAASLGTRLPSSSSTDAGYEMGAGPYVRVPDVTSGSGPSISGSSYVVSNALSASVAQQTQSGAAAAMDPLSTVILFPNNPESGGQGLVQLQLTSASVDCVSGTSSTDGTVVGKYDLTLKWWGRGPSDSVARMHTARWTYNSSTGSAPVAAAGSDTWNPANTFLANNTTLSQYVTSPILGAVPATVSPGAATSGLRGFVNGVFSLTSGSTLTNEPSPGYSQIKIQLGQLTCVADDQR